MKKVVGSRVRNGKSGDGKDKKKMSTSNSCSSRHLRGDIAQGNTAQPQSWISKVRDKAYSVVSSVPFDSRFFFWGGVQLLYPKQGCCCCKQPLNKGLNPILRFLKVMNNSICLLKMLTVSNWRHVLPGEQLR